jgi:multidrug efflux pump subunit AcrA (membrane-fusion protein)
VKIKLLFLLLILVSLSCAREEPEVVSRPITISAITVQRRDLSAFIYFTGIIRAQEEVKVYPRVEGKVYQKLVRKGDIVEKDQVLFTIDRDVVGYKFEKARVESPIWGRVSMVYVDTGDRVQPAIPLVLIQNDSVVKIRIWAGEKDYPRISEGQKASLEVAAYPQEEFEGEVSEVSPFFDPATHTALTEIEVANPDGRLKPGMFAGVRIEVDARKEVLTVLFDSVLKDSAGEYVYVIEDNHAHKRYVKTGLRAKNFLEIISGFEEKEVIAYRGKEFLEDGSRVKVVKE